MQAAHSCAIEEVPSQGPWLVELLCCGTEVLVSLDDLPCTDMSQAAWELAKISPWRFAYRFKCRQPYGWHSAGEGCRAGAVFPHCLKLPSNCPVWGNLGELCSHLNSSDRQHSFYGLSLKELGVFKAAERYWPLSSLQLESGVSHPFICGLEFASSSEKWFIHLVQVNVW